MICENCNSSMDEMNCKNPSTFYCINPNCASYHVMVQKS